MQTRIYLDNAATTPIDDAVLEAMLPFLKQNFGNPSTTYSEGRTARAAVEAARKNIATYLNAMPNEIFFTSGGTESNNTAIKCGVRDYGIKRLISSTIEHSCVRNAVIQTELQCKIETDYVELEPTGRARLDHLEELLGKSKEPTMVSLMHAHNELGTLNPVAEIAQLCHKYGALFHSDTVQTVGHIPIDVQQLGAGFISAAAHKIAGPKGVGFLYISRKNPIKALIDGGGQERQMRSGTENVAGIVGLAKALEVSIQNMNEYSRKINEIRRYFIEKLRQYFPNVRINGDYEGAYLYTVLNVSLPTDIALPMLLFQLDLQGVSASGGSACSAGALHPSPVANFLNLPPNYQTIRFSFAHSNTIEEINIVVEKLRSIVQPHVII